MPLVDKMKSRVALVVGGNGGIGSVVTRRLLGDGMKVCTTYNKHRNKLDELLTGPLGDELLCMRCDARNKDDIREVVSNVLLKHGRIDAVIFTLTPFLRNTRILDLEWTDYSEHLDLQLKAIHHFVKSLKEQIVSKGKIKFIVLLSEYCIGGPPKGLSHYVTAKYGVMGLARTLAVELAQYGCTVNMITPGMVDTPLLDNMPAKLIEMTAYENPLKRIARPEDVSNIVSFLASEESDYMNGASITINGGSVIN